MNSHKLGAAFVKRISAEVLESSAVRHPYLQSMQTGDFPNVELAIKDFAYQYGIYSAGFVGYVSAVINNLSRQNHRQILRCNLDEEQGDTHGVELPPEVLASVDGQPHTRLFRRFQEAVGVDSAFRKSTPRCQTAVLWSRQFMQLCELNEAVGVGAIGIGTEMIVSRIYDQILTGLKEFSDLTFTERVFFDLHSQCDEEHAAQLILIAEELAQDREACEQIEYGARMAVNLRTMFWDKMLDRARSFPASSSPPVESLPAVGYQESL